MDFSFLGDFSWDFFWFLIFFLLFEIFGIFVFFGDFFGIFGIWVSIFFKVFKHTTKSYCLIILIAQDIQCLQYAGFFSLGLFYTFWIVSAGAISWLAYPILERGSAILLLLLVHAQGPPLNSEIGWTGELWSKTNLLNWQN